MAEDQLLLSQEEIDALLSAVTPEASFKPPTPAAPEPDNSIKTYDFRQPDRFSKEQLRALRLIHETWARRVSVSLSAHLRTAVEVNLADIDQGVYSSLVQQIPDVGVYFIISLLPLPGHLMLYMNLDLAMLVLDRLMGGPGVVYRPGRSLTDLEFALLRSITDRLIGDFRDAWANTTQIQPHIDDVSSSLLLVPLGLPSDAILWMSFEVRIKGTASAMVLGLPYASLKSIAGRLSPYIWVASAEPSNSGGSSVQRRVEQTIERTKIPVNVVLGTTVLTLQELSCLQPGDVLPLNTRTNGLCQVMVNGRPKFRGRPGLQRQRLAVQIEQVVEEEWCQQEPENS